VAKGLSDYLICFNLGHFDPYFPFHQFPEYGTGNVSLFSLEMKEPEGPAATLEDERDPARLSRFSQMGLVPVEVAKTQPISEVHPDAQIFIQSLQRAAGRANAILPGHLEGPHPRIPLADSSNDVSHLYSAPKPDAEALSVPIRGGRLSVRKLTEPDPHRNIGPGKGYEIDPAMDSPGDDSWKRRIDKFVASQRPIS
jgi:hypothetical protein